MGCSDDIRWDRPIASTLGSASGSGGIEFVEIALFGWDYLFRPYVPTLLLLFALRLTGGL